MANVLISQGGNLCANEAKWKRGTIPAWAQKIKSVELGPMDAAFTMIQTAVHILNPAVCTHTSCHGDPRHQNRGTMTNTSDCVWLWGCVLGQRGSVWAVMRDQHEISAHSNRPQFSCSLKKGREEDVFFRRAERKAAVNVLNHQHTDAVITAVYLHFAAPYRRLKSRAPRWLREESPHFHFLDNRFPVIVVWKCVDQQTHRLSLNLLSKKVHIPSETGTFQTAGPLKLWGEVVIISKLAPLVVEVKECESAAGSVIGSCFPQQQWHFFIHYIRCWNRSTSEDKKVHQKQSVCKVLKSCGNRTPPLPSNRAWQLVWGICADVALFGFTACAYFLKNITALGCLKYTVPDVCGLLRCNFANKLFFSFHRGLFPQPANCENVFCFLSL